MIQGDATEPTMSAVRYHGPGESFRLEEVPRPEPGPGEVRVRVGAAGVCHTELHFESGVLDLGVAPVTMGHEIAGTVDAVGADVGGREEGDRVVLYYYHGCGDCPWCRQGEENLCRRPRHQYGFVSDGGYAEHVCVPAPNAVPLPDALSFEEAAPLACSATTGIHACNVAGLEEGETAVVYGVGAVGFGLVQVADLCGARVLGVGRTPEKLDRALDLGADHVVDATEVTEVADAVREWTDGKGAEVVFELVGTEETMRPSTEMLSRKGRLVFVGYSEDAYTVHPVELVVGEVEVTGSVGNTREELEEAVRLAAEGELETTVDRSLPLERWEEALEAVREGEAVGRVVLRP